MNPRSPLAYCLRHKAGTLLLVAFTALATAGFHLFIGLAHATYIAPAYAINGYLDRFSLVQPNLVETLDPETALMIQANPDVGRVLPEADLRIKVPNTGGAYFTFRLIGLDRTDTADVTAVCGVTVKEGTLPEPGTNGVALSEEIVRSLHLSVGDSFDRTTDGKLYMSIVRPLKLTGILTGDVRLGIMSREFLSRDDTPFDTVDTGLLVIARPGREEAVAGFLTESVRSTRVKTYTRQSKFEQVANDQELIYTVGLLVVALGTAAVTLVVGAINGLHFRARLPEIGTLYALGYGRRRIACRLTLETASIAWAGWALGIAAGWAILAAVSATVYGPRGFAFNPFDMTAVPFVTPVPLAVVGSAWLRNLRALGRLDAVSIIERGELSKEGSRPFRVKKVGTVNRPDPLSASTYLGRHFSRTILVIAVTAMMIVSTAFVMFVFSTAADTLKPGMNNLSRISAITPEDGPLDEATVRAIEMNPAVARTVPVYAFSPFRIAIPPMFPDRSIETYCVPEDGMEYLVNLYSLRLEEGSLPRPGTAEIVLPWTFAKNRKLHVGDTIGNPDRPIYPGAPALPVELTVSGIFARAASPADETWFSFMSLEFADSYRVSEKSLIIVPVSGRKAELDARLERAIAGKNIGLLTFENQTKAFKKEMNTMLFTFACMESVIAAVAILLLSGLQYIYMTGRKTESGILSALGFDRVRLKKRILYETLFTSGIAWLLGMAACFLVLVFLQRGVYDKAGLRLDYFTVLPWLSTLPVPAAFLAVSAGIFDRMVSSVDPVAVIERGTGST